MARSRLNDLTVGLRQQHGHERHDIRKTTGTREDTRMSGHPNHRGQYLRRHPISRVRIQHVFQPTAARRVFRQIGPKGVQQHIDIRQNHWRFSIASRRAELSFRSTPGSVPPLFLETGKEMRFLRRGERDCLRICRRPCSSNAVKVSWRRAASCRACSSSALSSRTVVLICLDIPDGQADVNPRRIVWTVGSACRCRLAALLRRLLSPAARPRPRGGEAAGAFWARPPKRTDRRGIPVPALS